MTVRDLLNKEISVKTVLVMVGVAALLGAAFAIGSELGGVATSKVRDLTAKKIDTDV